MYDIHKGFVDLLKWHTNLAKEHEARIAQLGLSELRDWQCLGAALQRIVAKNGVYSPSAIMGLTYDCHRSALEKFKELFSEDINPTTTFAQHAAAQLTPKIAPPAA